LLHKAGADVNQISKHGVSPLYLAIKCGSVECSKFLIDRKANVHLNEAAFSEFSPIFFAIK